jgi:outer membrane protein OmpA-like peptidoglycan-associated protein
MFNLCNLIGGYKADRVWNVIPYAGLGWAARGRADRKENGGGDNDNSFGTGNNWSGSLAVNAGILQNFRLSNRWAFNVEIGATILRNGFSAKPGLTGHDAMWRVTAGLTYNIGRVGWDNAPDVEALQGIYAGMIDDLQSELDDALAANEEKQAQIKDLENEKAALESEMSQMSKVKPINVHESIFFNLASAKIVSKKEELNIKAYAEAASAVGAKLAVVGYADISGSTEYNIKLSQQRAEAVAEILRANGAEVAVVTGNGETEEYKDRFLNRRVIIKVYEE